MTTPGSHRDAFDALGLKRTGRFLTFVRLVLLPETHPWDPDRRRSWRLPVAFAVSVLFLVLVMTSGCAGGQHREVTRAHGTLNANDASICSTIFTDMTARIAEGTGSERVFFNVQMPDAPGIVDVTISSASLPPGETIIVYNPKRTKVHIDQPFEVNVGKLDYAKKLMIEVPSCEADCALRVEAQGAFGAKAAEKSFLDQATLALSKIDRGFAEQTPVALGDDVARARRALVVSPCKAGDVEESAKQVEALIAGASDALYAMYGGEVPKSFDASSILSVKELAQYPSLAAHVQAVAAINETVPEAKRTEALFWLSLVRAEKRETWVKLIARAPAVASLDDAAARVELVRALSERPGSSVRLPGFEVMVRAPERSAIRGNANGFCFGKGSMIPGGEDPRAIALLRGWLSLGPKEGMQITSPEDIVRAGVAYQRAQKILCELPVDLGPLEVSLKQALEREELPGLARALSAIRIARATIAPDSPLAAALNKAVDRSLCTAFEEKRLDRALRTLPDFRRYVGDATEIFANASGQEISCTKGQLNAEAARDRLSRRYRAIFGELKGTPADLAVTVRDTFEIKGPHVARIAAPGSTALDMPPAFSPSAKQMAQWQSGCSEDACEQLQELISALGASGEVVAEACTVVPEKPERPKRVDVGPPGLVTPLDLKCLASEEFDLELRLQNGAGRALLVRSRQQFKIAGVQTTEHHKQRDLKLGWVYTVVLDLEDRQMFGTEKKITIKPSTDDQEIYWSTTRTPEL